MKMIFRLLCGLMAIVLAACTGDGLIQTENLQKPAGGKVISVKAYTPSEQPASRLVFEDQGTEGLKLSWSENDAFTAIVGNEELTFKYDTDSKEFIGTLPEGVGLTNGTKAYYPAYTGEYAADLSDQTGSLNSATTYMVGEYDETIQAFRFAHSTAILKATFSGLPKDAVVSSIKVGAAPYTISIPYTKGMDLAEAGIYIYLPNVAKDKNVVFSVETTAREVYTATQSVTLDEGIKEGSFYVAPIELTSAVCELPVGRDFAGAMYEFLQGKETQIKFIANSVNTDKSNQIGSSNAYMVANEGILEIHTAAPLFVFNADCSNMFPGSNNIISIDFGDNIDTSNVTNMSGMFYGSSLLASLDLSSFNTSKVTNMSNMFFNCSSLVSLDLSSFDTSNVADMSSMFAGCSSLVSLDLSSFNTSKVTNMNNMFVNCSSLVSLDLSSFDTSNVTDISEMFAGCSSLSSLDLRGFNFGSATSFTRIFRYLGSKATYKPIPVWVKDENDKTLLESVSTGIDSNNAQYILPCHLPDGKTFKEAVSKFLKNSELTQIKFIANSFAAFNGSPIGSSNAYMLDWGNTLEIYTAAPEFVFNANSAGMFEQLSEITSIDFGDNIDTSNVTDMSYMFAGCFALTSLDLSSFSFAKVTVFNDMFWDLGHHNGLYIPIWVKDAADETTLESASTGINSDYAEVQVKP